MKVVILTVVLAAVLSVDAKQSKKSQRSLCTDERNGAFIVDDTSWCNFYVCYEGEAISQACGEGSYFDRTELYCLPDTNNLCPPSICKVNGSYSSHPTNCNLFYVCYEGELVEQSCGPGSYFNSTNLYCEPDIDKICPQPECSVDGAFSPHPTNCSEFYVCYKGQLVQQSCGPNSYFNSTNLYCLPDTDNICREPECSVDGMFSPHPTNCASFYVCYDGLLVEQDCGTGSYFNKTTLQCLPDTDNICRSCVGGYSEGDFVANPDNCNSYYVCTQGELIEQGCGQGNYFNNITKTCERDSNGVCCPTICPGGYVEGDLIENSDSCYSYFVCTQGELVAQSCGTGNYFDSSSKTCNRDETGNCWPTATTPPVPCQCPGGYQEGDLIENNDSCFSYFVCTQGELVAQSCGTGNYFDSSSKTCARDQTGNCWPTATTPPVPCQCPGGYEEGDLIENSDSCFSYFVCTQGELVAQSCGTGNYFDSSSKTCVRDVTGNCWPTATTPPVPSQCPGGYQEGDLIENSDSCFSYFVCTQGELVAQSCGTGNYFDSSSKTCVRDQTGICWPSTVATTTNATAPRTCDGGYENGEFVPYPGSCYLFYVCYEGELIEDSCGYGNYFDDVTKNCVKDTTEKCWPSTSSSTATTLTPTTTSSATTPSIATSSVVSTTTSAPYPRTCDDGYEDGEFVPYPGSCYLFYMCYDGELIEESCGYGNYFDDVTQNCVKDTTEKCWPSTSSSTATTLTPTTTSSATTPSIATSSVVSTKTNATAPRTCDGGYENGEFVPYPGSCYLFYMCYEGELIEDSCGYGNYFDDVTKNCVKDTTEKCWPSTSSSTATTLAPTTTSPATTPSIATSSVVSTTTSAPYPRTCDDGYEDGEFVPYPGSCYLFYMCYDGELIEESCGYGNYFDDVTQNCVKDTTEKCWPSTSSSTATTLTPTTTSSATTPSIATSSVVSTKTNATAPRTCDGGYENGQFVPYPGSCYLFYVCYEGELIEDSCGYGNYFDDVTKNCVKDTTEKCWPSTSSSTATTLAPTTTSPATTPSIATSSVVSTTTSAPYPRTCDDGYEDGEFVPYPGSCYLFYMCYDGELIEESCGYGNYFDDVTQNCVKDTTEKCWPSTSSSTATTLTPTTTSSATTPSIATSSVVSTTTNATAPRTCDGGYENSEFVPYPGSCYLFYVCYEGELIEDSCGYGNYFDDVTKNCVKDTTEKCWPSTSSSTATTLAPTTTSPATTPSIATSSVVSTTTSAPYPRTCDDGYEDGEFVPYPGSCYLFYMCYDGELIEESCGYGNYFDAASKSCVKDTTEKCWPSTSSSTATTLTPTTTSSATTPSIATSSVVSTKTNATAPRTCDGGYENGQFVPYPGSCYLFYVCYEGELIEDSCGYGNYFDDVTKNCVKDTTEKCWPSTSSSTATTLAPTTTSPATTPSIATSSVVSTTTSAPYPRTCDDGYEDGEFVPYPGSCYLFYMCYDGELIEESCGYGNYFDDVTQNCVKDTTEKCWPSTSSSTATTLTPTTTSSATTPSIATSSVVSTTTNATAPRTCDGGYENSEFVPYPGSCYLFYVCYEGELIEDSCGYGNYFDDVTKNCVKDTTEKCWPSTSSSTATTLAPTTTSPATTPSIATSSVVSTTTSAPYPRTCDDGYEDGEFVPYPGSCYLFYMCYDGELIEESCGYGNYFDAASKSCVKDTTEKCWPSTSSSTATLTPTTTSSATTPSIATSSVVSTTTNATAPRTCDGGYENGEFVPYPGSCYLFYMCYDGELIEESCGYGNYFDDVTQNCVKDTTEKCWPSTSSSTATTLAPTTTSPATTPSIATSSVVSRTTSAPYPRTCDDGYEDGKFVPYPGSCYLFYMCYDGELIEESCGYGNYFDAASKSCVKDTTEKCWPSTSSSTATTLTPTTTSSATTPSIATSSVVSTKTNATAPRTCDGGYENSEFVPYPGSCYLFYVCYEGELIEDSCGYGNYFDDVTKNCVKDTTEKCWPSTSSSTATTLAPTTTSPATTPSIATSSVVSTTNDASCPRTCDGGYEDGEFVQHPGCYLFYMCYDGELIEESCGYGNYFDAASKSCVKDTTEKCWPSTSSSTATTLTPTTTSSATTPSIATSSVVSTKTNATAPRTCDGGYENSEFVPYPGSCYLFYVCYEGELIEDSCGYGNYFDDVTKNCVKDTTEKCWPSTSSSTATTLAPTTTSPATTPSIATSSVVSTTNDASCPRTCDGGYEDGEFVQHPGCYLFYMCYDGELIEESCGYGNYFDAASKSCVKDTTEKCWPSTSSSTATTLTPTTTSSATTPSIATSSVVSTKTNATAPRTCDGGYENSEFVPYPGSCYLFYVCYEGELIEDSCGYGNYFDDVTKNCVKDTTEKCWPSTSSSTATTLAPTTTSPATTPSIATSSVVSTTNDASCPRTCDGGYEDGEFVQHPGCYLFYMCYDGELIEESCGYGNYFDPVSKVCVFDTSGICWPVPSASSTPTEVSSTTISSTTSAPCTCNGGIENGDFIPHPDICYLFYICYQCELTEMSCGVGNYFDKVTKTCALDTTGICWSKFSSTSTSTSTESAPCTCTGGYREGDLISNPSSCYLFYICTGGELVEGNCGTGNYFNSSTNTCELDTGGYCWPVKPPSPPGPIPCECPNGVQEGQFIPHPSSCFLYHICTGGVLVVGNCGTGNYFNGGTNTCEPDTGGYCWPAKPPPPPGPTPCECPNGVQEGQFIPHPSSCFLYHICTGGELVEGNCGTGNYFNSGTNTCELDTGGYCWPVKAPSPPGPIPCDCPNGVQEGQFIPHPTSCFLYHICTGGELVDGNCGTGNYFNSGTNTCERDTSGYCWPAKPQPPAGPTPCECPNGVQEGQFIPHPTSCFLYHICTGGELVDGNCGTGNYFNSGTNICEPDTGGYCWPAKPQPPAGPTPCECPNGVQEGQFIPHPTSCFLYHICTGGELVDGNCGTGNYFNSGTNTCELDTGGYCWPVKAPSPPGPIPCDCPNGVQEGQFIPHPTSCFLYHICTGGELVEGNCGTGNYFNSGTNTCELDTGGYCWPVKAPSPPGPIPCDCPNGVQEGQFIPHPTSCFLYHICTGGELVEGNCGTGNYFNSGTNTCELDTGGYCWPVKAPSPPGPIPCDCPNGVQEGQFIPHPTSCFLYHICTGGELVDGNCGTGNYFNSGTNTCERDTSGYCWPAKPQPPAGPTPCECPNGVQEGQFIPHPTSCFLYHICTGGVLVVGNCGTGNYFNSGTNTCEPDTGGYCWPAKPQPPPGPTSCECPNGVQEGQFIPHPTSCFLYHICTGGELVDGNCGTGNYFNSGTNTCERDTSGYCWPAKPQPPAGPTPCECPNGVQEGQFIPHPTSCFLYHICTGGELVDGNCGTGNYFNSGTNICEPDTGGYCWPAKPQPPAGPTPCECPNGVQEGQFIPHPTSCFLYHICTGGELVDGNCGTGNYFNSGTNTCEPDTSGYCWPAKPQPPPGPTPCECPNGVEEGQFIPHPTSCFLYHICTGGELVDGNCGTGNYFNSGTNTCEPDTSGYCWPAKPQPPPGPTPCECPNGVQEGQFIPHPTSCFLYHICTGGELVDGNCGTGNYFNSGTNTCEPDTSGYCWPAKPQPPPGPTPCECPNGVQEGQFIPHPTSCFLYHICTGGELVDGNCGTGNYFNSGTNTCEPDTSGYCWPATPQPPPGPTPCECPNGVQEGQFISSPSACYLYYICTGGELVEGNCGTGNYFNKDSNICEPDTSGCCWPKENTCPGGYTNGEFVPDPAQCDKFFICFDGVLVEQDCGTGYFFDIDNNYCTRDVNRTCWDVDAVNTTCESVADGTFLPNTASCDKFFVCVNNTNVPQECGVGNLFNSATLTCVRDALGTCWKKVPNVCANTNNGIFVENPFNCQEFYVCYRNRAVLQQCGNGYWFNPSLLICQPDLSGKCINACQGTVGIVQLPHPNCNQFYSCDNGLTTGVGTCPKGTNFDATMRFCSATTVCVANLCYNLPNGAIRSVQNDLTSFYSCYNQIPMKLTCPLGTSFDADRLICTPDTGRCIGQKNGLTIASYNNPNAYYVCKNNMAIYGQCPSYAVFDEKKGICVHALRKRFANNVCAGELDGTMLLGNICNKFHLCLDGENIEQNCGAYSSFNQKLGYCVFNLSCFDENKICAKSSDIEKFPDARYETSFIKCNRGLAVFEKCPKNMIYSHDIGYCVPREMAMTEDELDELCYNASDNTMAPALDCRKFYICRNKIAILQQCAIDQYFDVNTGSCLADVERQCWLKGETLRTSYYLKTVCHEGQIRAYPSDCAHFEVCMFGDWKREECPMGYFFDFNTKVCIPGNADELCPTGRSAALRECVDDMRRPFEKLCTDYYRCENSHWKHRKCPAGEFYNIEMAKCSKDASACARNFSIQSTEVNHCISNETRASDVNCEIFYICHEGEWFYRYCEQGAYFNESLKACISNVGTCQLISKTGPCKNGTVKKSDFDPCVAYHLCVDGNWTLQHCPAKHHFNELHKVCMLDDGEETCQNDIKNTSSSCVEGNRRYQRSNCTAFDICSFGIWLPIQCQNGFYFDTALEVCIVNRGECSADGLLRRHCIDGTSGPSQSDCREFYYCSRNEWRKEMCSEGFQYNATLDKCISTNNTCAVTDLSSSIQHKCFGHKSGTYISHESDCTKYYLCVDDLAVEAECSYGRFYDKESKYCQLNDGACPLKMLIEDDICKGKSNGSRVQNPANCTTFFICNDAIAVLSYCPEEHYFNADIGVCQSDTGICNKPRLCIDKPGSYLPHETYCNIYYACVRGMAIPVACEENEIFDPITRNCTLDTEFRCIDGILVGDEICIHVQNGSLLVDSNDCTKYIICSNRLAQRLQCPHGYFFNSDLMFCMPDNGSCPYINGPKIPNTSTIPPDPISCVGKHGDLMADSENCNEFYMCIYGSLRHDKCFDGEFFSISTNSCIPMVDDKECSTAAEMSTLCITGEDRVNFADQSDCRKYYQCADTELQSKKCRTGESFDTLLGFCRQNDGTCLLENGQRVGACAGKHGKLTADMENCIGYFTCINGQKISEECENGEYFNKVTNTCEKDVNSTCRPVGDDFTNTTELSCIGLIELVFYPNILDDCRTFYQCVKGSPRVHKCPDDLLFNRETGICDWKDYVKCITEDYQNVGQICLNANNGTRFANTEDNCDSYFICDNGKITNFKCDQGLKYNKQMEKCDIAANVNCTMII